MRNLKIKNIRKFRLLYYITKTETSLNVLKKNKIYIYCRTREYYMMKIQSKVVEKFK